MTTGVETSAERLDGAIRCPRCKGSLAQEQSGLRCTGCRKSYAVKAGDIPIYDLYIDDRPEEQGRDPQQVWDREGFEEGYARSGYHESGLEFEKHLGRSNEVSVFHHERVKKLMVDWISPAQGQSVLDIGCGAGYFLCLIRDKYQSSGFGLKLYGVEISAFQISYMARRMKKEGLLDAVAALGNSEYLPFADNSFDVVVCSEVLEHVRNPVRALSEMRRVVKPTGVVILSTPSITAEKGWTAVLAPFVVLVKAIRGHKSNPDEGRGGYDIPWRPKELQQAFGSAGLSVQKFEQTGIIPHVYYFEFLPHFLVHPVVSFFVFVDRYLKFFLKPLANHLLVVASKSQTDRNLH